MTTNTIYHNPACGTSRKVLALMRAAGIEPTIIHYLQTPPTSTQIKEWCRHMGVPLRTLLRTKEALYTELDLGNEKWSEAQLLVLIAQHPILLNRPIVITPQGIRLCRPAETVLEILPL